MSQAVVVTNQASDDLIIERWLGKAKSEHTRRYYESDVMEAIGYIGKGLREITMIDVCAYQDSLADLSKGYQARKINALKSLLSFAFKTGYTPFNVGAIVQAPKVENTLAERILTEEQVVRIIALETNKRNHALLRLLYRSGVRVSEICDLKWRNVQENGSSGQITVYGKGDKTRSILLSEDVYAELMTLKASTSLPDDPVFMSRKHCHLDPSQVRRIVIDAVKRAGVQGNVSPHWFRHSHATHALHNGASIDLVKDTLGHSSIAITGKYTHARPDSSSGQYLRG